MSTAQKETRTGPPPITMRERLKMFLLTLFPVIAVLALSTLFIDYPKFFHQIHQDAAPPSADAITFDNSTFSSYFTIEKSERSPDRKSIRLLLRRIGILPTTTQPTTNPLTQDSLSRGYIRCEFFDDKGNFLSFTQARISPLHKSETMQLIVPLPTNPSPTRIVVTN
jgi:hypothetical protein